MDYLNDIGKTSEQIKQEKLGELGQPPSAVLTLLADLSGEYGSEARDIFNAFNRSANILRGVYKNSEFSALLSDAELTRLVRELISENRRPANIFEYHLVNLYRERINNEQVRLDIADVQRVNTQMKELFSNPNSPIYKNQSFFLDIDINDQLALLSKIKKLKNEEIHKHRDFKSEYFYRIVKGETATQLIDEHITLLAKQEEERAKAASITTFRQVPTETPLDSIEQQRRELLLQLPYQLRDQFRTASLEEITVQIERNKIAEFEKEVLRFMGMVRENIGKLTDLQFDFGQNGRANNYMINRIPTEVEIRVVCEKLVKGADIDYGSYMETFIKRLVTNDKYLPYYLKAVQMGNKFREEFGKSDVYQLAIYIAENLISGNERQVSHMRSVNEGTHRVDLFTMVKDFLSANFPQLARNPIPVEF